MKTVAPSLMQPAMKFQTMKPTVRYGRCCSSGIWNSMEYRMPSAMAVTAMLRVIHSGPITDRR